MTILSGSFRQTVQSFFLSLNIHAMDKCMKLPHDESNHWSVELTVVYSYWQRLFKVSGSGLPHHLIPDPIIWRYLGLKKEPSACKSGILLLSPRPSLYIPPLFLSMSNSIPLFSPLWQILSSLKQELVFLYSVKCNV